jgi:hypothetical protein
VLIEMNSILQLPTRHHRHRSVANRGTLLCHLFFGCSQATHGQRKSETTRTPETQEVFNAVSVGYIHFSVTQL